MGSHTSANRAAFGALMAAMGFGLVFADGMTRVVGILMLLAGGVFLFFAFYRFR